MTPPTDRPKPRRIVATLEPGQTVTVTVAKRCKVQLRLPDAAKATFVRPKKLKEPVDSEPKISQ